MTQTSGQKKKRPLSNPNQVCPTPDSQICGQSKQTASRKAVTEKKKKNTMFRLAPRRSKVQFHRNDNGGGQRAELNTSTHPL
jgi:hypothetical protein